MERKYSNGHQDEGFHFINKARNTPYQENKYSLSNSYVLKSWFLTME
jgi:hypothetical protein